MKSKHVFVQTLLALLVLWPVASFAAPCTEQDLARAVAAATNSVPVQYLHPPMMAIGDSMFNGMTSLTIDAGRARLSTPNLVARTLDIGQHFQEVNYARPVLFNIEDELRKDPATLLAQFGKGAIANIIAWQRDYPVGGGSEFAKHEPLLFDNIAIAGADSNQLLCDTAAKDNMLWRGVTPVPGIFNLPAGLGDWHQEINTSFILNPQDLDGTGGKPDLSNLSQMAQAMLRKPVRLLINIGSNDGVWRAGFDGAAPTAGEMAQLVDNMRMIVRLIPDDTKFVYVDNLVPPSRVPNFNPLPGARLVRTCPNAETYYSAYQTYLSLGPIAHVSADQACSLDELIAKLNADIESAMLDELRKRQKNDPGAANIQLQFVDFNKLLWSYDRKHDPAGKTLNIKWGGITLSLNNKVVHPFRLLRPRTGGITGYDNMHPSMVMYGLGAEEIVSGITNPNGPEIQHPDPSTPPVAVFPAIQLPQCVADELKSGSAASKRACPHPTDAKAMHTAIDMTAQEDDNLILAHEVLSAMGSPNEMLRAIRPGTKLSRSERIRDAATGCMLVQTLDLIGRASRSVTDRQSFAALNRSCEGVNNMYLKLTQ